jgi:DNA-binding CsgD family transcriptional regulator
MTAARSVAATLDDLPEPSRYATAIAHRIRGLLALAEGDREAAARWLSAAEQQLATLPIPFDLGRVRLELAELTEDPIPARQALEMLEALGARPTADRARRLLRRLGLRAAAPTQRRGANVLSAREAQVARLVALGLSNAEVAERLFISPRTVTTHLEKIYRRLGLAGRTALARYVLEREPPDT